MSDDAQPYTRETLPTLDAVDGMLQRSEARVDYSTGRAEFSDQYIIAGRDVTTLRGMFRRLLATAKQGVEAMELRDKAVDRMQVEQRLRGEFQRACLEADAKVRSFEDAERQSLRFMPGDEDLVATLHEYARSFGAEWLLARPDHSGRAVSSSASETTKESPAAAVERGVRETTERREGWAVLNRQADFDAAMDWCMENPIPQKVIDDAMLDLSALGFNPREPGIAETVLRKIIGLALYARESDTARSGRRDTEKA